MSIIKKTIWMKRVFDIILLLGLLYFTIYPQIWGGECNFYHPDCEEDSYCGIDNQCYKFPYQEIVDERGRTEKKQAIFVPSLIALAFVGAAYWYRKNDQK